MNYHYLYYYMVEFLSLGYKLLYSPAFIEEQILNLWSIKLRFTIYFCIFLLILMILIGYISCFMHRRLFRNRF